MKAAVMTGINELEIKDIMIPVINEEEILVKVKASSICGSDISALRKGVFHPSLPIVLGHETSGIVQQVGLKVNNLKTGDRVALEPAVPCRRCYLCKRGSYHMCRDTSHLAVNIDGGFAEYIKIHYLNAHKIPGNISFREASLLEPVSVCIHALKKSRLCFQDDIYIIGNGPFGLIFLQIAVLMGANKIFISGRRDYRNDIARSYGGRVIDIRKDNTYGIINEETSGKGVEVVVDAAGTNEVFKQAYEILSPQGRIVLFSHIESDININMSPIQSNEYEVIGSCRCPNTFIDAIKLLENKKIDLSKIITHSFSLDKVHQAINTAEDKESNCIKAVIEF